MKKDTQIQDSEEEYVEKTRMTKEVIIIILALPVWNTWTSSPRWISRFSQMDLQVPFAA